MFALKMADVCLCKRSICLFGNTEKVEKTQKILAFGLKLIMYGIIYRQVVKCTQWVLRIFEVRFEVQRSNVYHGPMLHTLLLSNVPCVPMTLNPSLVKCPSRLNVLRSKVRGLMSRGWMILWSNNRQSTFYYIQYLI